MTIGFETILLLFKDLELMCKKCKRSLRQEHRGRYSITGCAATSSCYKQTAHHGKPFETSVTSSVLPICYDPMFVACWQG